MKKLAGVLALAAAVALRAAEDPSPRSLEMVQMLYSDLAQEVGLDSTEEERFLTLLARQQDESSWPAMARFPNPCNATAPKAQLPQIVERVRRHPAQQAAMLGGRYARWLEYQSRAIVSLELLNDLGISLSFTPTPLTEGQRQSLTSTFAAHETRRRQALQDWIASPAALQSQDLRRDLLKQQLEHDARLVELARPHLSAPQRREFALQMERQTRRLREAMDAADGVACAQRR